MPDPERDLMRRYCDGDAAAFRALYAALAGRLLGYFMRMARDRAVAEDLVQLTFLKLHRARAAYVRDADPVPWIYAIAHRTFLDHARSRKRARVDVADDGAPPEMAAELGGAPAGTHDGADERQALTRATLDALQALPAPQREAVILTKLDGKSIQEAAVIAGTTPGAMKVRVSRGYSALRKLLGAGGEPT